MGAARPSRLKYVVSTYAVMAVCATTPAAAQDPVTDTVREQSCQALTASTVGLPDEVAADPAGGLPATWPAAAADAGLPARVYLRTATQSFNRLYEFAVAGGQIYGRRRDAVDTPWRALPLPPCFAGRVASIAVDDDEMIALDSGRRVFTMDNALKDAALWSWSKRWGPPVWTGPGYTLPTGVIAWSWSVVSPVEDRGWTDPAGNRTAIGSGKVSHIWGLRSGGRRLTFWDPWLPLDESYEMCGPERGRFEAVNLSASGSLIFVIGAHGDMFTRFYDFDLSGHDPLFFTYSYDDQRGKGDGAPIQLPAAPWVRQPMIRGTITSAISVHKVGVDGVHRILRVEGARRGTTGYWERDVASPAAAGWTFHATGVPLSRAVLDPTAPELLGRSEDGRYEMNDGSVLEDYNVYCSPAKLRLADGRVLTLHTVDGLRQSARARGLDDVPREQYGALRDGDHFTTVTVEATRSAVSIPSLGWTFRRVASPPPACLAKRARIGPRAIGPVHLALTDEQLLHRLPLPRRQLARAWRWCVDGGGAVTAAFDRRRRVALVVTTAPGHVVVVTRARGAQRRRYLRAAGFSG